MNVLYDKDHYKLALGQMNTACHLIDKCVVVAGWRRGGEGGVLACLFYFFFK